MSLRCFLQSRTKLSHDEFSHFYLRNVVMAGDFGRAVAADLRQVYVCVAVHALDFFLGTVRLLDHDTYCWYILQHLLARCQLAVQKVLHFCLQPHSRRRARVVERRGDDQLVVGEHGVLPVFFVSSCTLESKLAPVWWSKVDSLGKVELFF